MNRNHEGDKNSTDRSSPQMGDTSPGRKAQSGDPNDNLQQWERELRSDDAHGLGKEGEPGVQGTGPGSREVDR